MRKQFRGTQVSYTNLNGRKRLDTSPMGIASASSVPTGAASASSVPTGAASRSTPSSCEEEDLCSSPDNGNDNPNDQSNFDHLVVSMGSTAVEECAASTSRALPDLRMLAMLRAQQLKKEEKNGVVRKPRTPYTTRKKRVVVMKGPEPPSNASDGSVSASGYDPSCSSDGMGGLEFYSEDHGAHNASALVRLANLRGEERTTYQSSTLEITEHGSVATYEEGARIVDATGKVNTLETRTTVTTNVQRRVSCEINTGECGIPPA